MVRFKNRWLLLSVTAAPAARSRQSEASSTALPLARPEHVPASVTATAILTELRSALVQYFGDAGAGTAGGSLAIRYYNPRTGTALLRCARDNARLVWAALAMISHVDAARCRILCKHLAGTIKKAQLHAIDQDRLEIYRLRRLEQRQEQMHAQRRAQALDSIFGADARPTLGDTGAAAVDGRGPRAADAATLDADPAVQAQLETSKRLILSLPPAPAG